MSVFTPDEVVHLNEFQISRAGHPFTCPNRGDGNHRDWNGDDGALVATVRGWICPFCDYTQDWAHSVMKDGSAAKAHREMFARLFPKAGEAPSGLDSRDVAQAATEQTITPLHHGEEQ